MASDGEKRQPLITAHKRNGLVVALRDGKLVSINDVESGLACNCVCPDPLCGDRLVAHKGDVYAHHFQHYRKTDCKTGFETGLHLLAKDALAEALEFRLPAYTRGYGKDRDVIVEERMMRFDRGELEKRTGRLIADVVLYVGKTPLIVELVVTHWCDQEKIDLLKLGDLSCVEVDLSPYRDIWDMASLREIVVTQARRSWLHNKYAEDKAKKLVAAKLADHEEQVARNAGKLQRFYDSVRNRQQHQIVVPDANVPKALELYKGIGLEIPGDVCFPDRIAWQKIILDGMFREGSGYFGQGIEFKVIFGWVKHLVDKRFPEWPPKKIREEVIARVPEFKSSYDVVRSYLDRLAQLRFVTEFQYRWSLNDDLRQRINQAEQQIRLREGRHAKIAGLVSDVLDLVPENEKVGFDYDRWLDLTCELHRTPQQIIDEDCRIERYMTTTISNTEDYTELKAGVEQVLTMLCGRGQIVEDLFNLPVKRRIPDLLAAEAYEAEQKEQRQKLQAFEAGRAREKSLIVTLKGRYPGYDIEALVAERSFGGVPAFEAVRKDDVTYQGVLNALALELEMQAQEARRQREIEAERNRIQDLKDQLLVRCDTLMDPLAARLFLTSSNPKYGGRPIEQCVDQASFDALLLSASKALTTGKMARRK